MTVDKTACGDGRDGRVWLPRVASGRGDVDDALPVGRVVALQTLGAHGRHGDDSRRLRGQVEARGVDLARLDGGASVVRAAMLSMNLCCRSKFELPADATVSTPLFCAYRIARCTACQTGR